MLLFNKVKQYPQHTFQFCFNPCFNGCYSSTQFNWGDDDKNEVSILVLMDVTLQQTKFLKKGTYK